MNILKEGDRRGLGNWGKKVKVQKEYQYES